MPPMSHRLSLLLLPAHPDAAASAIRLLDRLRAEGFVSGTGPGSRPLVDGGFVRAGVESGLDGAGPRFVANRQGGFAVRCPLTDASVVSLFNGALEAWRAGAERTLDCSCGSVHDLAALRFLPEAGFARAWVFLLDVASAELTPDGARFAALELGGPDLGGLRVVGRRG